MGNEFLLGCDLILPLSFCETCRQNKLNELHLDGMTRGELEEQFMSEAEEYRRLNRLFEETLYRVICGEAFRRNTYYNSFGWWMRSQQQYETWSDDRKKKLMDQVKYAHTVYTQWDIILRNLVNDDITNIDARKLSLEQLFKARSEQWL